MNYTRVLSAILPVVLCPLPLVAPAADGDAALIKVRQKFFGIENPVRRTPPTSHRSSDASSCSTATSTAPGCQARRSIWRRTKILPQDFIDSRPEAVFLGHGHGDHADDAAYAAKWTGATIYAAPETCDVMQLDVQKMWNDPNLHNGGPAGVLSLLLRE